MTRILVGCPERVNWRHLRQCRGSDDTGEVGDGLILRGVLALIAGCAFIVVACGYRGVDIWVWDWADVTFTHRTRWGTPWTSLERMRLQFGFMGVGLVIVGLVAVTR
jgi:hypothetical protein|uniref:Uncharacterized protein n=1 Tax=Streptomyces sp. NBC_01393 TaxID=2903851 RepID=A0AAU3HY49_9ACTN